MASRLLGQVLRGVAPTTAAVCVERHAPAGHAGFAVRVPEVAADAFDESPLDS